MKGFYLIFAAAVFGLFCFLEYRGTSFDTSSRMPSPQYFSYRGVSSSSSSSSSSSRSSGGVYYSSHK
ncbi:MAG: hypothetical protein KC800_09920 [Candidatus Eremiobacteraeota bacterium]|nr:hypothetical protein [Candidatus Eremiobacteraeota bacterium]